MLEQLRENQQLFYEQAIVPLNSGRINHAYLIETNNNEDELVEVTPVSLRIRKKNLSELDRVRAFRAAGGKKAEE